MKVVGFGGSRPLLVCGMVAPVALMCIMVVVGQITPDYNPVSDTVSQMGTPDKPYSKVLNGGYVAYGVLMAAAACGLARTVGFGARAKTMAVLLGIHSLAAGLLGVFLDTPDLRPKQFPDDFMHNALSAVACLFLLMALLFFREIARHHRPLKVAGAVGIIVVALNLPLIVVPLLETLKPIAGLLQRVLSGMSYMWLSMVFLLLHARAADAFGEADVPRETASGQPQSRTCPTASD